MKKKEIEKVKQARLAKQEKKWKNLEN
jgi:hypothetical protein